MSDHIDALEQMNYKLQNRIDKIYHPFANPDKRSDRQVKYASSHHLNRSAMLEEDDLKNGRNLASHQSKHKSSQLRRLREGKREKKTLSNRGGSIESMGDFVMQQEKAEEEKNLRKESELHLIDIDRYLDEEYRDSDKDYDADYEEDQINEFEMTTSEDPKVKIFAQEQLEEMIRLEELELEMLTANLSLIDDEDSDVAIEDDDQSDSEPLKADSSFFLCATP